MVSRSSTPSLPAPKTRSDLSHHLRLRLCHPRTKRVAVRLEQVWKRKIHEHFGCLGVFLRSQYGILVSQSHNSRSEYFDQNYLVKTLVANVCITVEEVTHADGEEEATVNAVSLPFSAKSEAEAGGEKKGKKMLLSLIDSAIEATSTDHPEESIHNILSVETRVLSSFFKLCYWSSKGSESPTASDALVFKLKHPLSVISSIQIRPFEAHFQRGSPIYAPLFVRFSYGDGKCEIGEEIGDDWVSEGRDTSGAPSHSQGAPSSPHSGLGWTWVSQVYPMDQINALQEFKVPPTLCCGGYVRIELLGRTQRQEIDNLYYVCLSYVKILGRPVRDFGLIKKNDFDPGLGIGPGGEAESIPTLVYGMRGG